MNKVSYVPYLITIGYLALLALLFLVRRMLKERAAASDIRIGNGQTIGQRDEQDDYFSTAVAPHGTIAVLADGISGLSGGRLASTLAVTIFIEEFAKLTVPARLSDFFSRAARRSNQEILQKLRTGKGGTTLVAAVVVDGMLYWGAVGDSILMVFRKGEFVTVNQKHTLEHILEAKYLAGEITKSEVLHNPQRNRLVNYLGYEGFMNMEVGAQPFPLLPGDQVILCSDGIYNTLSELEMEQILTIYQSPHDAAQAMIDAVDSKRLDHQDNATVIILDSFC